MVNSQLMSFSLEHLTQRREAAKRFFGVLTDREAINFAPWRLCEEQKSLN
jgi:hypothetical protein